MEAPTTLTDALLDDLDDLSDVDEGEEQRKNEDASQIDSGLAANRGMDAPLGASSAPTDVSTSLPSDNWWPVNEGKQLLHDLSFQQHMSEITCSIAKATDEQDESKTGTISDPPLTTTTEENHDLLVKSNRYLVAANEDLVVAHKVLCQAYEAKFPELEELVPDATQYVKAVRIIGNSMDLTAKSISDGLNQFLTNHQIITLTVAESTSGGRQLTPHELEQVDTIASYMEQVIASQSTLLSFIERHMVGLAPSMCAMIGPRIAAQLLALAGSLPALSRIPASNLAVVGQVKHNSAVTRRTAQRGPHQGILAETDWVRQSSVKMQPKALKLLANKLALAIRYDCVNLETGRPRLAEAGVRFRAQMEEKLEKWAEPEKAPVLKALPK